MTTNVSMYLILSYSANASDAAIAAKLVKGTNVLPNHQFMVVNENM